MSSHPILPEARRAAIEAVFDEALADVRAASDVALLQECRAIFRSRVPLSLRAYVAAALALGSAGASKQQDRRGKKFDQAGGLHRTREADDARRSGRTKQESAPAAKSGKPARAEKEPKPDVEAREKHENRENRYRGEGVTLFVSAGRRQRFYARVAIKMLLDIPGVTEEAVGDIRTMDNYCFIVVDPAIEERVIQVLNGYDFKGRVLAANRARKRGEPSTHEDLGDFGGASDSSADDRIAEDASDSGID